MTQLRKTKATAGVIKVNARVDGGRPILMTKMLKREKLSGW